MNKNGWGLRAELLIILLFLICLVISVIGLNRVGLIGENSNSLMNPGDTFNYDSVEQKMITATKKYYQENYTGTEENIIIVRTSTLQSRGYLGKLYDGKNKECSGYVKIINSKGTPIYVAYLNCPNYYTTGYEKENDF